MPGGNLTCAVCGASRGLRGLDYLLDNDLLPRRRLAPFGIASPGVAEARQRRDVADTAEDWIAWEIVARVRSAGQYSAGSVLSFWTDFDGKLCDECSQMIKRQVAAQSEARQLLELAAEYDPGNATIRSNREAIG